MTPDAIGFLGKLGISGVLMIIWGFVYKVWETPSDRLKTILVVLSGMAVGLLFLFYDGASCTFKIATDYMFYGIQQGVTTVGLFKLGQAVGVYTPPGK